MFQNTFQKGLTAYITLLLGVFGYWFYKNNNTEFLLYVGIVGIVFLLLLLTNRMSGYSNSVLTWFSIWASLHMAGGGVFVSQDRRLYDVVLLPLVGDPFYILRYDQVVHFLGFGACVFLARDLLKKFLSLPRIGWVPLTFLVWTSALGLGAFNEILEFLVTVIVPSTGVGGYYNTGLDLCFNLLGATVFAGYAAIAYRNAYKNNSN